MSTYRPSSLGKHPYSDLEPPRDRSAKKQKTESEEEMPFMLPEPADMPPVPDVEGRPPFSYATLIGMAILRAPNRRLTLSNIYKWISDTFEYYRTAETGWTNSIRHNLSLNKNFKKVEKPKEDPGKGHYWMIESGMEKQFVAKDKASRRAAGITSSDAFYSDDVRPSSSHHEHIDSTRFPAENEMSSDATIPASDPPANEPELESAMPAPSGLQSSPSHINSSPPVARHDTPPRALPRFSAASRSGNRQKQIDSFRDSGYFSSIGSSATRPPFANPPDFSSPVLQERSIPKKHGRAEDEIRRMRGSSFEPSPIKNKPTIKQPGPSLLSSSPLRNDDLLGSPPLTPSLKAVPAPILKAPATDSPNTYLRKHREDIRGLLGTPAHGLSTLREELHFTPQFDLQNDPSPSKFSLQRSINKPMIFVDDDVTGLQLPTFDCDSPTANLQLEDYDLEAFWNRGSPTRSAVKRPALQRAATATGTCVLSDITNTKRQARLASPIAFNETALLQEARATDTDKGVFNLTADDLPSPLKSIPDENNAFWGFHQPVSEGDENAFGLDLTKGFGKIGSQSLGYPENKENEYAMPRTATANKASRGGARPAFGRSLTNIF